MIRAITYFAPLLAVACAPVALTRDRAERLCREESGLADGVQGSLGVGVGSRGAAGKVGITITDRVFNPQGEAEFMADCVARRMSGQPRPTTAGITVGASL
ncbi:MAG: hypothetical protein LJE68_17520 [Rhodobacter sp.]|nr:hypothetical protein [Rhodobacter sp.]